MHEACTCVRVHVCQYSLLGGMEKKDQELPADHVMDLEWLA